MTMLPEEFAAQFDARTLAYLPGFVQDSRPLVIVVGNGAHTPAGHALLVSLSNQAARIHKRIVYVGELEHPLLCADVFRAGTLLNATVGLVGRINPLSNVEAVSCLPSSEPLLTIGVGADVKVDLALGAVGWLAQLGSHAVLGTDKTSIWGALLASCLGANVALHRILGQRRLPTGDFSLWQHAREGTLQGPAQDGPLDIGRVLQVGAGAVGTALDFFLSFFGVVGVWVVVDGDPVDVSNLNRQLLFLAEDAGFPSGRPANKAETVAQRMGASFIPSPHWWGADNAVVEGAYDVILALANEFGVRNALQTRQPTVLLHATTSPNWQAQLHRHVAGHDDCINCRLPSETPRFMCSTEEITTAEGKHFDASIPPLSATAGILLAAELRRLQVGRLMDESQNFTAVELSQERPLVQRKTRRCRESCTVRLLPQVRRTIDSHSRWRELDAGNSFWAPSTS